MAKSSRSLRFTSPEEMSPGMRALYERQQAGEQPRVLGIDREPDGTTIAVHGLTDGSNTLVTAVDTIRPPRKSKFAATAVVVDGIRFDSKREARYYEALKLRVAAGEVSFFLRQVPLHLPGGTKLVVDFLEFLTDGRARFVDTKGVQTTAFRIKKREVEHHYPIEVELA